MTSTGFFGGKRVLEHGGVAQQTVEFGEDELGDGYILVALNRGQPVACGIVPRRGAVEGVEQEVGVNE